MIKSVVNGAGHSPLRNSMSGNPAGRPTSQDIVKFHKAANIKDLGYTNFTTDRPVKVSIKGKAKQV